MKPKRVHGLRKDGKGGIEGLPLQLLVLVVVAGVCLTAMLGWIGSAETPKSISDVDVETGELEVEEAFGFTGKYVSCGVCVIKVLDQNKDPLEGATVVLAGLSIRTADGETVHGTTDSDGKVSFEDMYVEMNGHVGYITVEVSKSGYGVNASCKIVVVN